jgi:glycosyltransferase involved in cell wall biosynthesis
VQITIDARMILNHQTGIGRYLIGLAQGFKQLNQADQITFLIQDQLSPEHPFRVLAGDNIILEEIPYQHMNLRAWKNIPQLVQQSKPDLFHYPHFDLPWTAPNPIVITIHDLKYLSQPQFFRNNRLFKHLIYRIMMSISAHRADHIITVSKNTANDLVHYFDINPEKISTIYLGVEEKFFERKPVNQINQSLKKLRIDQPYFLLVGERRPHKNINALIKAFILFLEKQTHFQLVIVGRSYQDYKEPEKLVTELDLKNSVHFIDRINDDDLQILYQAATAFISLSQYEGFGLPALEAMASQTPVIISNNTSFPEVVGDTGILIPPNDIYQAVASMMEITNNEKIRQELIRRGFERAQTFTWKKCAQETLNIYQQTINEYRES